MAMTFWNKCSNIYFYGGRERWINLEQVWLTCSSALRVRKDLDTKLLLLINLARCTREKGKQHAST